jgi:transcriptional regulator with XRE-family HTH domain
MKRLREQRERAGLSQAHLAALSGISQNAISNYERGDREAGSDALSALAKALNCSADYLLEMTDDPNPVRLPEGLSEAEQSIVLALRSGDKLKAIRLITGE